MSQTGSQLHGASSSLYLIQMISYPVRLMYFKNDHVTISFNVIRLFQIQTPRLVSIKLHNQLSEQRLSLETLHFTGRSSPILIT